MLDAEILLSHILDLSRAKLFAHFADPLKQHNQEHFHSLVERRSLFEPVAYLIGKKEFYGRDFTVNSFVLIPRPATETLVASAIDCFKTDNDPELTLFADIGTGSGAIAVTLAAETNSPVIAVDESERAISVAQKNAENHNMGELVNFRIGDLLTPISDLFETLRTHSKKQVSSVYPYKHLILCANLPYLSDNQIETLQKNVKEFEPIEALKAGPDGLELYWRLFKQISKARKILPRKVTAIIEIDPCQSTKAVNMIKHQFPESKPEIKKDLQGLDRIVITEV